MKTKILRALLSWGAINLFILAPLACLLVTNVPHAALVTLKTDKRVTVKVGGAASFERVKGCNASPEAQVVKIYLPCEFDGEKMCVGYDGEANFELKGLTLVRKFVLTRAYSFEKDGDIYRCSPNGGFALHLPVKGVLALAMAEVLLILLAFGAQFLMKIEERPRPCLISSVLTAGVASALVALVIPAQTVLSNTALLDFSLGLFFGQAALYVLIGTLLLGLGLYFAQKSFGYLPHALVLAFVVYEYFQTGILSIGEPAINGELAYYQNSNLILRDELVLLSILGVLVCAYHWLRDYLHWVALAMMMMLGASLLDVKQKTVVDNRGSILSPGFCSKRDAVMNVVHSAKRNVMMIVLDSIGTKVAGDVFAEDPTLRDVFSGFTAYMNNVGSHNKTETSTAATTSGVMFDPKGDYSPAQYPALPMAETSVLASYVKAGVPCSAFFGSVLYGYSSFLPEKKEEGDAVEKDPFWYRPPSIPALNLFETTRFRLTPFAGKFNMLLMTCIGTPSYASIVDESSLFPVLARAPVCDDLKNNFETFHTNGGHSPFDIDKNGNSVDMVWTWEGYYNKSYYVLHQAAKLMGEYKRLGIYDKSFIIIMADHGWYDHTMTKDESLFFDRAKPMLLVKPIGAKGPMVISAEPTWHLNLRKLLEAAREIDLTSEQVLSILRSSNRFFRFVNGYEYDEIIDFKFDDAGNSL